MRALARREQPFRDLTRPQREREQHCAGRRPAQKSAQQLDRAGVRPVQVVQQEDERLRRSEQVEKLSHGSVAPEAFLLNRSSLGEAVIRQ